MHEITLKVGPVGSGWSIDCSLLEPIFFRSGARAEAAGRDLALHLSGAGHDVRMLICDRTEQYVVTHRYFGRFEA